jgi:hypothetical protein
MRWPSSETKRRWPCLEILQYSAEPPPARQFGYQPQINLAWLSLKSIIFPTISMESFEDSPDANRHGGSSILRQLVAKKWSSCLRRGDVAAMG